MQVIDRCAGSVLFDGHPAGKDLAIGGGHHRGDDLLGVGAVELAVNLVGAVHEGQADTAHGHGYVLIGGGDAQPLAGIVLAEEQGLRIGVTPHGAIALVLGLAFCIERIIYLALSKINAVKFINEIEAAVQAGDIEKAKSIARDTRGPIASIYYQGLLRLNDGAEAVEKSVVAYGAVQASKLESGCSWITLFIGMAPSLGFLGTVIGMVQAFDDIQAAGDISPTVVAGGMKVALLTTIFGIVVALILQVFYNYILAEIEGLTAKMEDSTISLLDIVAKYCNKK